MNDPLAGRDPHTTSSEDVLFHLILKISDGRTPHVNIVICVSRPSGSINII